MATRKASANQALTGEVTSIKSNLKSAPASMKASEEIVVSLKDEARQEFASILEFERSRVTRWARVIQNHCRVPGDWDIYASEVRLAGVEHLVNAHNAPLLAAVNAEDIPEAQKAAKRAGILKAFNIDSPFKSWPIKAQEQYKSRFAPMFSILSRVGKALIQMERSKVVSLLTDESKSFSQKVQELPKGKAGRKAGVTIKKVDPVVPPQTAPKHEAVASPASLSTLQGEAKKQAEVETFNVFLRALAALPDEWMRGAVLQLSVRLDKCLAPEWKNLAPVMGAAVKAYSDRVDGPKKAPEEAKPSEAATAPVVEPVEAPAKPEKAASKVRAKKAA